MKKIMIMLALALFISIANNNAIAQVTIGSGTPPAKAALLELKDREPQSDNITSKTGGLLLPRVELESRTTLMPFIADDQDFTNNVDKVKDKHIGLLVYNLTDNPDKNLCPGIYEWVGELWERLSRPCSFLEFICPTISTDQHFVNIGTSFSYASTVKYNSEFRKEITTTISHTYDNGLSIIVPPQTIIQGNDEVFQFTVSGDGTTHLGTHMLPLADLGDKLGISISSACLISVIVTLPPLELTCNTVSSTARVGTYMEGTVEIPYNLSRGSYKIPTGNIGQVVNGITPSIETEQNLSTSGTITVTLKGTPTNAGNTSIPITIGGISCSINVEVSAPLTITCSDIYTTGFVNQDMSITSPTIEVPYTLSGGAYTLPAGIIGTHHGITARVEEQTLTAASGFITVKFEGTPIQNLDKIPFSINIQGNPCHIYLSVIQPPTICPDGLVAKAFVFQQNSKWYVVSPTGSYNISGNNYATIALTIECDTEEEALRHPDALQYCGDNTTERCIRLFDRNGAFVANIYMTQESATWYGNVGIVTAGNGCWASIIAYSNSSIKSTYGKIGQLGAINVSGKFGYLGIINGEATMSNKSLR